MNVFKLFSAFFTFIYFLNPLSAFGQSVCTDYTVTPGTAISSSGAGAIYNTSINVPDSYVLTDVNVTVDIDHTWNADLDISIISPSGTIIELSTGNGGDGDNYNNVTFDDASTNTLPNGNNNLSGTYQPEGSLAGLNGENTNGNWTLRIIDDASGDGGTINSITLNLCYTPIVPVICTNYTITPGTAISSSGSNTYNTSINVPDSYVLTDVNVTVDVDHTWNADLDISIISPSGTIIELSTGNGGDGDNYNNVTFDDASTNTLPNGNNNLSGTYQPEGSLAGLNGENANGNWVLRVIDNFNLDGGSINSITLNLCYTQPTVNGYLGPGGVGHIGTSNNLVLWLMPEVIGNSNSQWVDSSGRGFNLNSGTGPTLNSNDTNGYDSYSFNGTNQYFEKSYESVLNPNEFSIFTASNVTSSGNYKAIISSSDNPPTKGFILYAVPTSNNWQFWTGGNSGPWQTTDSNTSTANSWALQSMFYQNTANGKSLYINDNAPTSNAHSLTPNSSKPLRIGAGRNESNPDYYFQGKISEVIMFNAALNAAQKIIVNNYLSAKYNTPLTTNNIYTQDNAANGNFDHDVAGIGQASDGSNHTDSQGTGIVRVNNPTNLSNDKFLFWGEETKDPTYNFSTNTTNYTEQLNSRWKVRRQGNVGRLDVTFDISSMDLSGMQNCADLQLVVDDTYDFSSPEDVYNLTISGTTATATNVRLRQDRYFTLRYTNQIVWDGTSFYNGSEAINAPNHTDSCLKLTVKAGTTATLTVNAHVREIEIEAGATLNVADGILLETEDQIIINANGTIDLLGEAQIIQNHTGATLNSGSGILKIRQQGTSNFYNYNYWSAPVNRAGYWQIGYLEDTNGVINFTNLQNANPTTSPITLSNQWLYSFNGISSNYYDWEPLSTTSNIAPGLGYTMKGSGTETTEQGYIFKGLPNDGDYNFSITTGNDILIGNPYPSALDADQFITDNLPVIDGTLYFWEHFASNNTHVLRDYEGGYATYNLMMSLAAVADPSGLTSGNGTATKPRPTQHINVGQGFFTTITNTGTLRFNNGQRAFARESANETIYYKTNTKNKTITTIDERPKIWFSFTVPKGYIKTIGLGYDNQATYNYDSGYDAKSYENLKNDINWKLNDERLVIQALPEINLQDKLPLEIKVTDMGLYKFSINEMENVSEYLNIYLFDNTQNIYYNLRDSEAQLFINTEGNQNQFSIVFEKQNILGTHEYNKNEVFVSYSSNSKTLELHYNAPLTQIKTLTFYNTLGQEVKRIKSPNSNRINMSHFADGIYILKIETKNAAGLKNIKFVKY